MEEIKVPEKETGNPGDASAYRKGDGHPHVVSSREGRKRFGRGITLQRVI